MFFLEQINGDGDSVSVNSYEVHNVIHIGLHYTLSLLLKQDNKHSGTHLGELDGKVHRTLTTADENMNKKAELSQR